MFGSLFVGFGLIAEVPHRRGRADAGHAASAAPRCCSGASLRDVVVLVVQARSCSPRGVAFGLRAPSPACVLAVLLVAAIAVATSAASYAMALLVKSEEALGAAAQRRRRAVAAALGHPAADDARAGVAARGLATSTRSSTSSTPCARRSTATLLTGTVGVGLLVGAALIAAGMAFGTRTFQRD